MANEWANASLVVRTRDSWGVFIKALRALFVEDMVSRLDEWSDRTRYPDLNRELHSIRVRRNYVEHPESEDSRDEDEQCCIRDVGKRFPTSGNEWLGLQLKTLDRMLARLNDVIQQTARP